MNLQAQANAMFKAAEEFKVCKRNKSGTLNGNALHAIKRRLVDTLMADGEGRSFAWDLAHDLAKNYK